MTELDPYLTIVNKNNPFKLSMIMPFTMVDVHDADGETFIEEKTLECLTKLRKHLEENYGISLLLTSAGRTIKRQQQVLDEQIALRGESARATTALPGESEHHLGTAVDIQPYPTKRLKAHLLLKKALPEKIVNRLGPTYAQRSEMYSIIHKVIKDNSKEFGAIVRYEAGKQDKTGYPAERWHIRYVGPEHAAIINENNMCLEEYIEFLKAHQQDFA